MQSRYNDFLLPEPPPPADVAAIDVNVFFGPGRVLTTIAGGLLRWRGIGFPGDDWDFMNTLGVPPAETMSKLASKMQAETSGQVLVSVNGQTDPGRNSVDLLDGISDFTGEGFAYSLFRAGDPP